MEGNTLPAIVYVEGLLATFQQVNILLATGLPATFPAVLATMYNNNTEENKQWNK